MTRDVYRASLYRGVINLWVEDETTRSYLSHLWNDASIVFFLGGGIDGVRAIAHDAEKAGFANVFGVVDRDFLASNIGDWDNPRKSFRVFVLPNHEIENDLLDADALAACRFNNLKRSATEIDSYMHERASRLCWWAACRGAVSEIRKRYRADFLADPKSPPVDDLECAWTHICESAWFKRTMVEIPPVTPDNVRDDLIRLHMESMHQLVDGRWRGEFSGKEILRDAASRFFDRTKAPGYRANKAEFDSDLAKEVAAWQAANERVPDHFVRLRESLRRRVGL